MSLLFLESFDDSGLASDLIKWDTVHSSITSGDISTSFGRTVKGCRIDNNGYNGLTKNIPAATTVIVGNAVYFGAGGNAVSTVGNLTFAQTGLVHIQIRYDGVNNRIIAYRGNGTTQLGVSANGTFTPRVWHYVEVKVTISDTVGVVEVHVDGVQVMNLTNQDTNNGGSTINQILWGANSGSTAHQYIDDIYIFNTAGSVNNDFQGDCRVRCRFPDGDSTPEDWTLSAGADSFALIDEDPPNGDTDYLESDTAAQITDVTMGNLTDIGQTVYGVQVAVVTRRDSSATRNVRTRIDSNGSVANGADHTPPNGTYQMFLDIFETNPDGGGAWTPTTINAMEVGIEARD